MAVIEWLQSPDQASGHQGTLLFSTNMQIGCTYTANHRVHIILFLFFSGFVVFVIMVVA